MSDLRAPDPTLDAMSRDDDFVLLAGEDDPATAHAFPVVPCGSEGTVSLARDARWFAVPCRECFPDAAEPGHRCPTAIHTDRQCRGYRDPHLAWQVSS